MESSESSGMEVDHPLVQKSALLIGPTYDQLSEKCRLQGTLNDVEMMKEIISKPPFNFHSIKELTHISATRSNILESFAQICNEAPPNSVVLIYYSGHGCSWKGQEEGHYDEGLVPADANHSNLERLCITGEALTEHLQTLADKNVATTVIFDCCFSGRMYRGARAVSDNPNFKITAVKQVDVSSPEPDPMEVDETDDCPFPVQETWTEKWEKEGWRPSDSDKFVYLSACNSNQKAYEGVFDDTGKVCGLFTKVLVGVLRDVAIEDKEISYEVLFSLIREKFLQDNIEVQSPIANIKNQTPQLEGGEFGTVLFDVKTVKLRTNLIEITKVENNEVELNAGRLQLMGDGEYEVFKAGVSADYPSEQCVGTVDVNQAHIGITTSKGYIIKPSKNDAIKPGCVARLARCGSMRSYNVVLGSHDAAANMKSKIEETNMFNIREQQEKDSDYILTMESINGKDCWCARRGGTITLPLVYPGEEDIMAKNLAKDARYRFTRKLELSDSREMQKVSLKIVNIQAVDKNFFMDQRLRKQIMANSLRIEKDLYGDGALQDHLPIFRAHKFYTKEVDGKKKDYLVDRSGEALIVQVKNHEKYNIHICLLLLQLDGSIIPLYPKRKGRTIELKPGESAEEMVRMYIPTDSLRRYYEPDTNKPEPNAAVDTLMLLAATDVCDFGSLLQSEIDFGGPMREVRDEEMGRCENLNPLEKFQMALCFRNGGDIDGTTPHQWLVMKRSFVLKNE